MFSCPDMIEDSRFDRIAMVVERTTLPVLLRMPLITDEGYALGTLCVLDFEPRKLTFEQTEALRRLSRQVLTLLSCVKKLIEHDRTMQAARAAREEAPRKKRAPRSSSTDFCPAPSLRN